jgi:hypothetical protein
MRTLFLLVFVLSLVQADDADRLLLIHGPRLEWAHTRDLLLERAAFIDADLAEATRSASWQTRAMVEVVRMKIADAAAFAQHAQMATKILDPYREVISASNTIKTLMEKFRELGPPQPMGIPVPVLIDLVLSADSVNSENAPLIAALHFWSEPRPELMPVLWECADLRCRLPMEQGLLATGDQAAIFLRHRLEVDDKNQNRSWILDGMGPRILAALGDTTAFPRYRQLITAKKQSPDTSSEDLLTLDETALAAAEILAAAHDPEAMPLLVDQFENYSTIHGRQQTATSSTDQSQTVVERLADAISQYGQAALESLRACSKRIADELDHGYGEVDRVALAHALIFRLEATDEQSRAIAILRWRLALRAEPEVLLALRRLTGESIASWVTGHRWLHDAWRKPSVLWSRLETCAASGDQSLVPLIAEFATETRKEFDTLSSKIGGQRGAAAVDTQLLREHAGAALFAQRMSTVVLAADEALLVIVGLGGPQVEAALAAASAHAEWADLAAAGRLVVADRVDDLVAALADPRIPVAESAAFMLWTRKDPRAQAGLLRAAARRQGDNHQRWLERALELGDISDALHELAQSEDDLRLRVLTAALTVEQTTRGELQRIGDAVETAANHISSMHVIRGGSIVSAGKNLLVPAAKLPPSPFEAGASAPDPRLEASDRIILEAKCLFGSGVIRRGIAACALAAIGDDRSLPVIAASADMGALGGTNPVIAALKSYGEKGAAMAAAVPPLIPGQADTGLQMSRQRAGTQVLAELGDLRAPEQILKGFATLFADREIEGWEYRASVYVDASARCTDPRLIDPLLAALTQSESIKGNILAQLGRYRDPCCEAVLLAAVMKGSTAAAKSKFTSAHSPTTDMYSDMALRPLAATGLIESWGENAVQRLKALAQQHDPIARMSALFIMAELSHPEYPPYPAQTKWTIAEPMRSNLVKQMREAAFPLLAAGLEDQDQDVRYLAMRGMVIFAGGKEENGNNIDGQRTVYSAVVPGDQRAVAPLTAWLRRGGEADFQLINYLGRDGDAESGKALLAVLDRSGRNPSAGLLEALAKLRPPGLLPRCEGLVRTADEGQTISSAVDALYHSGHEGRVALLRLLREAKSHRLQALLARRLSQAGERAALPLIRELLEKTVADGYALPEYADEQVPENSVRTWSFTCASFAAALRRLDRESARLALIPILKNSEIELHTRALQLFFEPRIGSEATW